MTIWKKAISVATSAALLASLLATAVAPGALASVAVTSVGSIPVGGTSATELTLLFTERSKAGGLCPVQSPPDPDLLGLNNAAGSLVFTINDVNGGDVSFSGTAVKSAPGSLGTVTATASGNALTISWTASDCANVETIQITGLKIAAATTATPGPVNAVLTGDFAAFFAAPSTATATGVIQSSNTLAAGADTADVLLSSVCSFAATGGTTANASFSDTSDSRPVTAAPAPVAGLQAVTFGAGIAAHPAGTTVTQVVSYAAACPAGALVGAVGVIGDSLIYNAPGGQTRLNPAENNQFVNYTLSATERTLGFLKVDATVTLTIATAGVTFSQAPRYQTTAGNVVLFGVSGTNTSYGVLSADRKSATWTVTTASTAAVDGRVLQHLLRRGLDGCHRHAGRRHARHERRRRGADLAQQCGRRSGPHRDGDLSGRLHRREQPDRGPGHSHRGRPRLLPGRRRLQQHVGDLPDLQHVRERAVRLGSVGQGHRR